MAALVRSAARRRGRTRKREIEERKRRFTPVQYMCMHMHMCICTCACTPDVLSGGPPSWGLEYRGLPVLWLRLFTGSMRMYLNHSLNKH